MVRSRNTLARTAFAVVLAAMLVLVAAPAMAETSPDDRTDLETTERPPCNDGYAVVDQGPVEAGVDDWCRPYATITTTTAIPPCGDGFALVDQGPVTVGLDPFCSPYVEEDVTASSIPACGNGFEASAGPATAGVGPYCEAYVSVN